MLNEHNYILLAIHLRYIYLCNYFVLLHIIADCVTDAMWVLSIAIHKASGSLSRSMLAQLDEVFTLALLCSDIWPSRKAWIFRYSSRIAATVHIRILHSSLCISSARSPMRVTIGAATGGGS